MIIRTEDTILYNTEALDREALNARVTIVACFAAPLILVEALISTTITAVSSDTLFLIIVATVIAALFLTGIFRVHEKHVWRDSGVDARHLQRIKDSTTHYSDIDGIHIPDDCLTSWVLSRSDIGGAHKFQKIINNATV